ncbi:MAG: glycosyltransferase family 4 protein [bacterium]
MPSPSGLTSPLSDRPIRVFFPCTGLGSQQRGFETFTLECASALRSDARLDVTVFAGGPVTDGPAHVLRNFRRDSRAARWLALLHGRGGYFSEQLTFFLSFLPHLVWRRPAVVYFADLNLGNLCWHWRRMSRQRFALVFYNGGLTSKPFTRADVIQQLTPVGLEEAMARGEDPRRQIVLPHGVDVPPALPLRATPGQRRALGLPDDRPVVLSVGMLDTTIKRMDYLIREVATLPTPRPFLCLLGAESAQTAEVCALAERMLGSANVLIRTVARAQVNDYYCAADIFVLASLREGFGLAYVEALAHGLPIVAHDFAVSRAVLDNLAYLVDLSVSGGAARAIAHVIAAGENESQRLERHESARARFSWDVLRDRYATMLLDAAGIHSP